MGPLGFVAVAYGRGLKAEHRRSTRISESTRARVEVADLNSSTTPRSQAPKAAQFTLLFTSGMAVAENREGSRMAPWTD